MRKGWGEATLIEKTDDVARYSVHYSSSRLESSEKTEEVSIRYPRNDYLDDWLDLASPVMAGLVTKILRDREVSGEWPPVKSWVA